MESSTPDTLVVALAGSTATALAFGAWQALWRTRGAGRPPSVRWLLVAAASCAAQLWVSLPGVSLPPHPVGALLQVIGVLNVAATWAFAMSLLDDHWHWTPLRIGALGALALSPAVYALASLGAMPSAWVVAWAPWGSVPAGAAVVHLVVRALRGARDDLVDERRRWRHGLVGVLAVGLLMVLVGESWGGVPGERLRMATAAVVAFGAMAVMAGWPTAAWGVKTSKPASAPPESAPLDAIELGRLNQLMVEERVFLDAELDLPGLAKRLGVPPHRLRQLINGRLGHRHFSDFLNEARLAEVKRRLADPALARRPILTLALEAGFPSLATFNRVFKQREGLTPTAFRQQALGAALDKEPPHSMN